MWEIHDGDLVRYRCRVGHAWSSESLIARQQESLEAALWTALRALEENSQLASAAAKRLRDRGSLQLAQRFQDNATSAELRAEVIRDVLIGAHGAESPVNGESHTAEPPVGDTRSSN